MQKIAHSGRPAAGLVTGAASDDANPFSFRRLRSLDAASGHQRLL